MLWTFLVIIGCFSGWLLWRDDKRRNARDSEAETLMSAGIPESNARYFAGCHWWNETPLYKRIFADPPMLYTRQTIHDKDPYQTNIAYDFVNGLSISTDHCQVKVEQYKKYKTPPLSTCVYFSNGDHQDDVWQYAYSSCSETLCGHTAIVEYLSRGYDENASPTKIMESYPGPRLSDYAV